MPGTTPIPDDGLEAGAPIAVRHVSAAQPRPPSLRSITHQYAAMAFYTAGASTVEQRGRWRVRAGDVLIVPPGEPHRALERRGVEFWGVGFCVPCLPSTVSPPLLAPFERVRDGAAAIVRIPRQRRAWLSRLFRELSAQTKGPAASERVPAQQSLLTLIVDEVAQAMRRDTPTAPAGGIAREALSVIERRCLGPLTLAAVAAAVGRSPAHLTTALRRATGRPVGAWIRAYRLAEARRLLRHGDLKMPDIAARVGYGDVTHFIRTFRREHGVTPAAWRAMAGLRPSAGD